MALKPRVRIPDSVAAGDIITVKTIVSHRMESGQRKDFDGKLIPRNIINRFEATYDNETVFAMDLDTAVAANPYIEFTARIDRPGTFRLTWTDDDGETTELLHDVTLRGKTP